MFNILKHAAVVSVVSLLASVAPAQIALQAQRIATGLDAPVFATMPPGDMNRLFIVEQNNHRILILNRGSGSVNATPFLTVPGVDTSGERGLLGLAFDPNYATNGFFYVDFTGGGDGRTIVRRYHVSADPDVADSSSATAVLEIAQPQANHNGGWIGFGPDGFLYIGMGDGGNGNDEGDGHTEPGGNAQDITDNFLGKILRIDVHGDDFPADPGRNYAVPASNPFVGSVGDDEIWAYGLRNPWRPSFDRLTGDFYIADVGQGQTEEIDFQSAASAGGENYGWRLREGTHATPAGVGGTAPAGAINPIYEYEHGSGATQGDSVTGGYVYRGPISALQGYYLFADFINSRTWMFKFDGSAPATFDGNNIVAFTDITNLISTDVGSIGSISSFGEDPVGNLFIVDYGGSIFEITGVITDFGDSDHFKLYKVKPSARFEAFGPITLADMFGSAQYDVTRALQLGLPADKNGEGRVDPTTHLVEYKLSTDRGSANTTVSIVNQCDGISVEVGKPVTLLVPANKSLVSTPASPDPSSHDVDHFLCYKARSTTRLPRGTQVSLVDQFDGGQSRRYELLKVSKLCVPADKSGSPLFLSGPSEGLPKTIQPATRKDAGDLMLCYRAKLARKFIVQAGCGAAVIGDRGTAIDPRQPKHVRLNGVNTNDQFGPELFETVKETEVCIPSVSR